MHSNKLVGDGKLDPLLEELKNELQKVYGSHLRSIILFGSYARGDYDPESDIDIMVLVDLDDAGQRQFSNALVEKVADIFIKYGVLISVIDSNYKDFNSRASYVPFYKNVIREGVVVYAV
ncbi:MAG: nucleotidyltransferase domain-containing protein [Clostridiaceae bacterium]|nr:nucleotidyltransferase domain-containing protein [Clostridiaceae bacterium]